MASESREMQKWRLSEQLICHKCEEKKRTGWKSAPFKGNIPHHLYSRAKTRPLEPTARTDEGGGEAAGGSCGDGVDVNHFHHWFTRTQHAVCQRSHTAYLLVLISIILAVKPQYGRWGGGVGVGVREGWGVYKWQQSCMFNRHQRGATCKVKAVICEKQICYDHT